MFAYVRLIRKKLSRALRAATGERGKRANFKFLTVRSLISAWTGGGYGNAVLRTATSARGHYGRPKLMNSERAMDRAGNRGAEILTMDYRMNADRGPSKCGMRNAEWGANSALTPALSPRRGGIK